jgi:Sulfate permease family
MSAKTPMSARAATTRWQDVIAGLSIAGLLLPEAMAYSSVANLPLQTGVIALFAGLTCYGLLGTSRYAIVSATSSSAVVLAAASASLANGDSGLRITLAVGLKTILVRLKTHPGMGGPRPAVNISQSGNGCQVKRVPILAGCHMPPIWHHSIMQRNYNKKTCQTEAR